jgi:hypothetical protein
MHDVDLAVVWIAAWFQHLFMLCRLLQNVCGVQLILTTLQL